MELYFTCVLALGDNWGPLIINSEEEYNTTVLTVEDDVVRNDCFTGLALIGGSITSDRLNYFEQPERYFPNGSGMSFKHTHRTITEQLQNNM